jgi:hypothetical protein
MPLHTSNDISIADKSSQTVSQTLASSPEGATKSYLARFGVIYWLNLCNFSQTIPFFGPSPIKDFVWMRVKSINFKMIVSFVHAVQGQFPKLGRFYVERHYQARRIV